MYGSRNTSADLDLLVISEPQYPEGPVVIGYLDLLSVSWERFTYLVSNFEPAMVEPLLKGEHLVGDLNSWIELQRSVRSTKPTETTVAYLSKRWLSLFCDARSYLEMMQEDASRFNQTAALTNLGFAISCRLVAREYSRQERQGPLLLEEIEQLSGSDLLKAVRTLLHIIKVGQNSRCLLEPLTTLFTTFEKEVLVGSRAFP